MLHQSLFQFEKFEIFFQIFATLLINCSDYDDEDFYRRKKNIYRYRYIFFLISELCTVIHTHTHTNHNFFSVHFFSVLFVCLSWSTIIIIIIMCLMMMTIIVSKDCMCVYVCLHASVIYTYNSFILFMYIFLLSLIFIFIISLYLSVNDN